MAVRTTAAEVQAIIDTDNDIWDDQFITNASVVVDNISTKATAEDITVTSATLLLIETYIAAHFYALRDPQYESKRTGRAAAKFQTGKKGKGFEATDWGAMAIELDPTGYLEGEEVKVHWIGTVRD